MKRFLEGCSKLEDGRYRIRENFSFSKENCKKLPLNEANSIVESNGKKYKCINAYEFNVWELNKYNLNERMYSSELANHVIKENIATLAFMNHPNGDDGDMKDVCAIGRNPKIKDGWLKVEGYLIGKHGQLIEDILQAQGDIQISSSCLGNLDEQGIVCLDESFELERYFDVVSNASNSYKHTIEQDIQLDLTKNESVDKKDSSIVEDKKEINKVETMASPNKKISNLEEKMFVDFISRKIREIADFEVKQQVTEYKELLESFLDESVQEFKLDKFKEDVTGKLTEAEKLVESLIEKGKETDTLKETKKQVIEKYENLEKQFEELQEKYKKVCEVADNSKEFHSKFKNLLEIEKAKSNGMFDAESYLQLTKVLETLETENKQVKVQSNKMLKEFRALKGSYKKKVVNEEAKKVEFDKLIELKKIEQIKERKQAKLRQQNEERKAKSKKVFAEKKYEETHANFRNDEQVADYYLQVVSNFPYVEEAKEKMLSCKTLNEAYKVFLNVKNEYESKDNFTESLKTEHISEDAKFDFGHGIVESSFTKGFK